MTEKFVYYFSGSRKGAYNEMTYKKKRSFNNIGSSREGVTEKFVYYFSGSGKGLTMK